MTFIELLEVAFSYGFMTRALVVGIMIGLSSSFLGSFLVLKKYSMIGDGLAHVSFAAVAIALFFQQAPLIILIPLVSLAAILILHLSKTSNIAGDAAIGLLASFSIAFGTVLASINGGFTVDLYSYLFGSILLLTKADLWLSIGLSVAVLGIVIRMYQSLFMITYDETFAKVQGVATNRMNYVLAVLTALTVIVGIRALGVMLISSLIIFPTVIALQFFKGFKATILIAATISVFLVIIGLFLSFYLDLPSGSTIVLLNGFVFVLVYIYNSLFRKVV